MGNMIWLLIGGAVFGIANVIPGVSGGTMAVVMGIYDDLIDAVGNFFKDWKKNLKFLLPFLIGAGVAILLFSTLIKMLLENYSTQVNFFFLGLILGSVPMIWSKAFKSKAQITGIIGLLAGLAIMILMTYFSPEESTAAFTTLNVGRFFLLLVSGFIAAITMIIPGVSGSMMLLIIGVYYTVIGAVSELNILLLIPTAIGILLGLLIGTKLIAICMKKFSHVTYCTILGLVIGSVLPVFKESGFITMASDNGFNIIVITAALCLITGAILAFILGREKSDEGKAATKGER